MDINIIKCTHYKIKSKVPIKAQRQKLANLPDPSSGPSARHVLVRPPPGTAGAADG